jgi:PAS domain S-box-containing protein
VIVEAAARARREAEWNAAVLDAMFAAAPIGMALLDLDLRFARVNKLMARIDGVPPEGHVGRSPREILPGFPAEAVEEAFRRVLETNAPLDTYLAGETPAAPGETRRWRVTWYAVRVGGEPVGVGVLVSEDRPGRR